LEDERADVEAENSWDVVETVEPAALEAILNALDGLPRAL
jgi:hypothetical protein